MLVQDKERKTGNERFEGFTMDLAKELAGILHFNFTFKLVDDGNVNKTKMSFVQRSEAKQAE